MNPKLNSNFVPKIEDIAYKLLGVERKMKLEIETENLPVYGLEQVSPDSEKSHSNDSNALNAKFGNYHMYEYFEAKNDDLESPAFEPIGTLDACPDTEKKSLDNDDMDISDGDEMPQCEMKEIKSNVSSISGLTSNDSNNSSNGTFGGTSTKSLREENPENIIGNELQRNDSYHAKKKTFNSSTFLSRKHDIVIDQDSVLSQVSSETNTSRLSIVTNVITNSVENDETKCNQIDTGDGCVNVGCIYGISEDTQMQKFNESSSSNESSSKYTSKSKSEILYKSQISQFNIKKDDKKIEENEKMNFDLAVEVKDQDDSDFVTERKLTRKGNEIKRRNVLMYENQFIENVKNIQQSKLVATVVSDNNVLSVSYCSSARVYLNFA